LLHKFLLTVPPPLQLLLLRLPLQPWIQLQPPPPTGLVLAQIFVYILILRSACFVWEGVEYLKVPSAYEQEDYIFSLWTV
jgi:hypothetical protein